MFTRCRLLKGFYVLKVLMIILAVSQLSACGQEKEAASKTNVEMQKLAASCLTTQSQCQIKSELGTFEVKFYQVQSTVLKINSVDKNIKETMQQIQTELPFSIILNFVNESERMTEISTVTGYLEGKDMFMGKVPVFFDKEIQEGEFIASSLLASCAEDVMVWRLWLTVQMADEQKSEQRFFIDFESQRL